MASTAAPDATTFDLSPFAGLLSGEVAVVTGAAMGNGAAIARGLALCGARVVMADMNEAALAETVRTLQAEGGDVLPVTMNVTDMEDCTRLAETAKAQYGDVSILINNAGIVRRIRAHDDDFLTSVQSQLDVNCMGSIQMVKALLPQLEATAGRVVNLGSIASTVTTPGGAGYGMSKGAVLMMTRNLATELAPRGIRVNALAPGVIKTPMTVASRENPEVARKYAEHIPMERFGEPEELVGPVLFLVSRLSSYVTGTIVPVDGGYLTV